MNSYIRQAGISLVEILVALIISVFLLGGIVQVYVGNKATFAFTNALAEIQENGRFALDFMSLDLRLVDDWGCVVPNNRPAPNNNINNTIGGGNPAGYTSSLHNFTGEEAIEGTNGATDTLTIRGSKPGQTNVESPFFANTSNRLVTDAISTLAAGDIILVTRCGTNQGRPDIEADILLVTSVAPLAGNTQRDYTVGGAKSQQFENDAAVIELQTVTYSIGVGASGEPALFRAEFGVVQELVEGIEDMQVLYGVDSDNDDFPNQYITANNVVDFDDVVAVRVALLVRSIDDFVTESAQTYSYNGVQTTAGDNRIRQVFTTTIALRNRIGS